MKSGITAAEEIFENIEKSHEIVSYEEKMKSTWTWKELYEERNVKKAFKKGMAAGIMYSALTGHILKGREPWTMKNTMTDSEST